MTKKFQVSLLGAAAACCVCFASFAAPYSDEVYSDADTRPAVEDVEESATVVSATDAETVTKPDTDSDYSEEKTDQGPSPSGSVVESDTPPIPSETTEPDTAPSTPDTDVEVDTDTPSETDVPGNDTVEPTVEPIDEPSTSDTDDPDDADSVDDDFTPSTVTSSDIDVLIQSMDDNILDEMFANGERYTPTTFLQTYVCKDPNFQAVINAYYR